MTLPPQIKPKHKGIVHPKMYRLFITFLSFMSFFNLINTIEDVLKEAENLPANNFVFNSCLIDI